jgi:uncharacterized protein
MRIGSVFRACLIGTILCMPQFAAVQAAEPPGKITFLLVYRPGPAWLAGKPVSEQPLKEHGSYMLSLYAKGVLKFAGPFTDDAGGAVVLEVDSEAQAREIVANDPAVLTHVFVHELHPWRLMPWDQYLKKDDAASNPALKKP